MTPVGLPHSEIPGSKRACRSPRHIAACHVLLRLSVPRHPPSTLSNLTIKCPDLMRSAVRMHASQRARPCISLSTSPYSIVKETLIAKIDAEQRAERDAHRGYPRKRRGNGGADRDRTDDPLLAKQVLSQLSYSPGAADPAESRIGGLRIEIAPAVLNSQFTNLNSRNGGPR